jgi:hypothetical protein
VLALETLRGTRIAGNPSLLDRGVASHNAIVLRIAPDELLVIPRGHDAADPPPELIAVEETGFVGCWLTPDELAAQVVPHIDWELPVDRPALAQGLVAGVPAKLWLESGRALLLCAAPYAHELTERLR